MANMAFRSTCGWESSYGYLPLHRFPLAPLSLTG